MNIFKSITIAAFAFTAACTDAPGEVTITALDLGPDELELDPAQGTTYVFSSRDGAIDLRRISIDHHGLEQLLAPVVETPELMSGTRAAVECVDAGYRVAIATELPEGTIARGAESTSGNP